MKKRSRTDLLNAVAALCERYPHWRFGQLVANIAGWSDQDVWEVTDDQLLDAARSHLGQIHSPESSTDLSVSMRGME